MTARSGEEAAFRRRRLRSARPRRARHAPFGASRAALDDLAGVEARVLGLTDEDASAAVAVVERLLTHDILVRARAAEARGACRRETPVT